MPPLGTIIVLIIPFTFADTKKLLTLSNFITSLSNSTPIISSLRGPIKLHYSQTYNKSTSGV